MTDRNRFYTLKKALASIDALEHKYVLCLATLTKLRETLQREYDELARRNHWR